MTATSEDKGVEEDMSDIKDNEKKKEHAKYCMKEWTTITKRSQLLTMSEQMIISDW